MQIKFLLFSVIIHLYLFQQLTVAQNFTEDNWIQGYHAKSDTTYLLFDAKLYNIETLNRVVVTGQFRGWNTNMDDENWQLTLQGNHRWVLGVYNPDFTIIPPANPFKFRIDEGIWLDPPEIAPNKEGGNLIFLYGVEAPDLVAEIIDNRTIVCYLQGVERSFNPDDYLLTNAQGEKIPIATIKPNTSKKTLIFTETEMDPARVHYLSIPSQKLKAEVRYDGWFRTLYSNKPLGANISRDNKSTSFRLFAPRATKIELNFYKSKDDTKPSKRHKMRKDEQGVWEFEAKKNLKGQWYDFSVYGHDEPGNHFYETIEETVSDPYSRVNDDAWGKSRVWPATEPAAPLKNGIPAMQDVIAYEVHVQDFTDLLPVSNEEKGTFKAMITPELKNKTGQSIGFDYLLDLGINVVHLMPVQEYLHYPDDEWIESFKDDAFMQKHGISLENYQWGYRTTHAMAVENRYRVKGSENGAEREQFRDLVQAFHDNEIAVIIDIVPNHTGENMDGVNYYFNFNGIDKIYYYRTKNYEHIGEYGNEVKTENRPMVQRWLIDQCHYFIQEFGIDGFRIDLAGQIDEQTLIALKKAIGEEKILYGEPWIGSNDPEYEKNPDWDWYKSDSPITFFQDDARNAFKGGAFLDPDNPEPWKERGFAGGNYHERDNVLLALQNYFPEEISPLSGINYSDIHDNWALADQFALKNWNGNLGVDEDRFKLAALLLFTSQGPLVLHGGTEMMRSKAHSELKETVKVMKSGRKIYIHGKRDTYNMRIPNQFIWENVGLNKDDKGSANNYSDMISFWKGLIRFRLSEKGKVFRNPDAIANDFYKFILPDNPYLLGYIIDNSVFVLINTSEEEAVFKDIDLPYGSWKLIGNNGGVDHKNGVWDILPFQILEGNRSISMRLPSKSFKMWIKE